MAPRKPGQTTLTRDQIVKTALKLVDEQGVKGHSMRDLAAELGVDVSTLYYHVPNKAALYEFVADAIMEDNDFSSLDESWAPAEKFRHVAREFRTTLLRHPNAIPLMIGKSMRSPAQMRPVELILGFLYEAGMSPSDALLTLDSMAAYVLGCVAGETGMQSDPRADEELDALALLPANEFANIHRMLTETTDIEMSNFHEIQFEFGLDAMARGLFNEE